MEGNVAAEGAAAPPRGDTPTNDSAKQKKGKDLKVNIPANRTNIKKNPSTPSFIRPTTGWRCRFCWCCECSRTLVIVFTIISCALFIGIGSFGYYLFFTNQGIKDFLITYDTVRCEGDAYAGKLWLQMHSISSIPSKDDISDSDVYLSVYTDADPASRVDSEVFLDTMTGSFDDLTVICIPKGTTRVYADVMDKDAIGANDFIGYVSWNMAALETGFDSHGNTATANYNLEDAAGNTMNAYITLSLSYFPSEDIATVLSSVESGDIVLFSGDTASGAVIRIGTQSQWSHIGIAFVEDGKSYVIESSTNKAQLHDCSDGDINVGVEMLSFYDKVTCGYYSFVALRKLVLDNSPLNRTSIHNALKQYFFSAQGTPYELFEVEMLSSAFGWNIIGDDSSMFCSEFVAYAWRLQLRNQALLVGQQCGV